MLDGIKNDKDQRPREKQRVGRHLRKTDKNFGMGKELVSHVENAEAATS